MVVPNPKGKVTLASQGVAGGQDAQRSWIAVPRENGLSGKQSNLLKNNMKLLEGSALRSRRAEMHPMVQAPDDFMPPYWELLQST